MNEYVSYGRLGRVFYSTDVELFGPSDTLHAVYCPNLACYSVARVPCVPDRLRLAPDVVAEVVSDVARASDTQTKFSDYERAGVRESWLIDPIEDRMMFYRLQDGRYIEASTDNDAQLGEVYASEAVAGCRLVLRPIREAFRAL